MVPPNHLSDLSQHPDDPNKDGDENIFKYQDEEGNEMEETVGSYHFVHGWHAQGHSDQVFS